jgi:hypothetical protein
VWVIQLVCEYIGDGWRIDNTNHEWIILELGIGYLAGSLRARHCRRHHQRAGNGAEHAGKNCHSNRM